MFDLRVGPASRPEIAIECVSDAHTELVRAWKKGNPGGKPHQMNVPGDWALEVSAEANIAKSKKSIEQLLTRLHHDQIQHASCKDDQTTHTGHCKALASLHIESVFCGNRSGSGKVYVSMSLPGGIVNETANGVAEWTSAFLCHERRRDVLFKLDNSGAPGRHVFVIMTSSGDVTGPIAYHFIFTGRLPGVQPKLPPSVTGVWLCPTWAPRGMLFDGIGWQSVAVEALMSADSTT